MGFSISITINSDGLDGLVKNAPQIDPIISDLVSADIQKKAKDRAVVRTGLMKNSIVRVVAGPKFFVIAKAGYSGFVEFGTHKMGAQPFMVPAVEAADVDGAAQAALKRVGF